MRRNFIFIISLLLQFAALAQLPQERISANADQQCYVVGEHLRLNVAVTFPDGTPSPSRVAYVEIADAMHPWVQTMLTLEDGLGYVEIPLPDALHSGAYQLSVYTRGLRNFGEEAFFTQQIGIINPTKLSTKDDIKFMPGDDASITTNLVAVPSAEVSIPTPTNFPYNYEIEGHIVTAHVESEAKDIETVRLALVGNTPMVYDGRKAGESDYLFYTTGIYGDRPIYVCAYSHDGSSLPTKLVSPYANSLPSVLPTLVVYCTEDALKARYAEAQRQQAADQWLKNNAAQPTAPVTFMSTTPQRSYNLDEWATMNTVREMVTEFIRGVDIRRTKGIQQLYIDQQVPALVLFDGIPIYDVEKFLNYDPHLLKSVHIFDERYTFGQSFCHGIVAFTSRTGKLSNFTLDPGTTFASYQFPQK